MKTATIITTFTIALSACATQPSNIEAAHVPSSTYSATDCSRLQTDIVDAEAALSAATAEQQSDADADAISMGVGLVLFAPALLFLAATDNNEEAIARAKGELNAMKAEAARRC